MSYLLTSCPTPIQLSTIWFRHTLVSVHDFLSHLICSVQIIVYYLQSWTTAGTQQNGAGQPVCREQRLSLRSHINRPKEQKRYFLFNQTLSSCLDHFEVHAWSTHVTDFALTAHSFCVWESDFHSVVSLSAKRTNNTRSSPSVTYCIVCFCLVCSTSVDPVPSYCEQGLLFLETVSSGPPSPRLKVVCCR